MEHGQWPLVTEVGDKNKRSLWIKRLPTVLSQAQRARSCQKYQISSEQTCNGSEESRVVDPEKFVSDQTPDPNFREVSSPTPDPIPVSDPATLVFASRELRGKLALYL